MAQPPTTPIRTIAIVGATGQLGKHITSALLKNPTFTITALTRGTSTSSFPSGVKPFSVDYSTPSTLTAALTGIDALIITLAVSAPPDTQSKLIHAAASAGVPWILPNEYGNDTNDAASDETGMGPPKRAARKLIEDLGVSSWIGVASGFWYEYSLSGPGLFGIDIAKRSVLLFDDGRQKVSVSTWAQVGRAVARLLALPVHAQAGDGPAKEETATLNEYRNRMVYVQSFSVSQRDMLDSLNRVLKLEDADWTITGIGAKQRFDEARGMLKEGNRMGFAYMLYTRYFFPGEDAALFEKRGRLENERLGLSGEDLDEATRKAVEMAEEGYFAKLSYAR
ncbi:CipA protein [Bimuria novae-zelandiae CBS 107.79]|uniref:CipA protein n=1 Tax=Bimuria novae-zelandiae CBS 107.79 TaxID=1447943 RepID=A0A6A5UQH2_9PLEO|nr:CipA protein [Bimuria novae-zelandiae CBS 107.79]